jgi:hypothetical protein
MSEAHCVIHASPNSPIVSSSPARSLGNSVAYANPLVFMSASAAGVEMNAISALAATACLLLATMPAENWV